MADLMASVRGFFGATSGEKSVPKPATPDGYSREKWIAEVRATQPGGYEGEVGATLAHYLGQSRDDVRAQLRKLFPFSGDRLQIVTLEILRKMVNEEAVVFGGEGEKFPLYGATDKDGNAVEKLDAGGVLWSDVLSRADVQRKLTAANRITRALRRCFVRVSWDADACAVCLRVFLPTSVFPRFAADSRDLDRSRGVYLEIEPAHVNGKVLRRWEFWSAGESPRNFVEDEKGGIHVGESGGENPYRDDDGRAVVPLVSFGDEDDDLGYWLLPRAQLLDAARAMSVHHSALLHLTRVQGFGQWISEADGSNPEPWPAVTAFGSDEIVAVPAGRRLRNEAPSAPLTQVREVGEGYYRQVATLENLPAGSVTAEGRAASSGVALQVEREPLTELRREQTGRYRAPTLRLLELVRIVWNAHQPSNATRFAGSVDWVPGALVPPSDPEAENRVDEAEIRMGVSSPVRVLMRREGLTLDEAKVRAAELQDEQRAQRPGANPFALETDESEAEPVPIEDAPTLPDGVQAASDTALNGAQVASLLEIIGSVATGQLPRESAVEIIVAAFNVPAEVAERMMGSVGHGFTPTPPPDAPAPQG